MSDVSHLLIKALSKWQFGTWMPELARKPTSLEMDLVRTRWLGGVRDAQKFDVSAVFPTFSNELVDTAWDQNEDGELRAPFLTCLFDFGLYPQNGQRHLILVQPLPGEGPHPQSKKDLRTALFCLLPDGEWFTFGVEVVILAGLPRKGAAGFSSTFDGIEITSIDQEHINFVVMRTLVELVMAALAMMSSPSVKLTPVKAPKFINSKRSPEARSRSTHTPSSPSTRSAFGGTWNAWAERTPHRACTGVEGTNATCQTERRRGCEPASLAIHSPEPSHTTTL
jgi:hypothetical protein